MIHHTIPAESHVGVPATDCRWRCASNECRKTWKGCTTGCVLRHAIACYKLRDDKCQFASQNLASEAIGAAIEALDASARTTKERTENGRGVTEKSSHHYFFTSGCKEHTVCLTFAIVKLICVGGLPPYILELSEWKEFMTIAVSYFHCFSCGYKNCLIPQEAARVCELQDDILQTEDNLTMSFDGLATLGQESVYTIHATTSGQLVFFLEGHSGVDSDIPHSGLHTCSSMCISLFSAN